MQTNNGVTATPCCVFTPDPPIMLQGYVNDPQMQSVRASLLKGIAPPQCAVCVKVEKQNEHSFRLLAERFHPELSDKIKQINDPNYVDIKNIIVQTSNICNLKCLPCLYSSYVRTAELKKIGIGKHFPVLQTNKNLESILEHDFKQLSLLGGEPFYDKITFEFLELLVKEGRSKDVRIDLNTNMTHVSREKIEFLILNFQSVLIKASLDGIGPVNDYLRYPSDWATIEKNIDMLQDYPEVTLVASTALSNLALIKFYQVIEWAAARDINLFITPVEDPNFLRPALLPVNIKNQLLPIYQNLKDKLTGRIWDRTEHCIDSAIHICQDVDSDISDFNVCLDWIAKHDQLRNNSVTKVFAELVDYVK